MQIGRYKIVRELGRGAMGVVYHAEDPHIGRAVAVKTIRLNEVTNAQERARLRERLFREARSAGMLSHPGIVTIYDVDQQDDLAYIAMEFVDGPTLDEVMSRAEPLAPRQMFDVLGQTAVALDYAHSKGIVHRDVKPANIMLDPEGAAKITDFGIAKVTASEQFTLTGAIVGTPHYMAPEQVQGHPLDGRADQFSLAVIAFEMLTGEKPFTGEQLTTVVYRIVAEEPAPVARINATLSAPIEAVLRKGLAKKPEARYRTCQEMVDALESACAASEGWKSLPRGGSLSVPTVSEARRPVREMPPPHRRRRTEDTVVDRRRVGVLPVALALLVAAGLVGLIAWQATPWLSRTATPAVESAGDPAPAPAEDGVKKPSAMGPPEAPPPPAKPPVETQPVAEKLPEPAAEKPAEPEPEPKPEPEAEAPPPAPAPRPKPAPRGVVAIMVPTSPPGAVAALDGRADSECRTPCVLLATPGRHTVSVTLPGHLTERREILVTSNPQDLPLISLRGVTGTLMLNTAPPGATILIDGRAWQQNTPAQINLQPGTYNITVEKNGRRVSERVEIRTGTTVYRKIPLGP